MSSRGLDTNFPSNSLAAAEVKQSSGYDWHSRASFKGRTAKSTIHLAAVSRPTFVDAVVYFSPFTPLPLFSIGASVRQMQYIRTRQTSIQ